MRLHVQFSIWVLLPANQSFHSQHSQTNFTFSGDSAEKTTRPVLGDALLSRQCNEVALETAGCAVIMSSRILTPSATYGVS
jgi:hypothetical protein